MENIKNKISFKTYDKYKDSEVEYIGNIPEHWEIDMLKNNIYKIISGGTPNTSNKQFWENGYINWCNIKDMGKNLELQKTSKKITIKGKEDKNLKIIPINTILISIYATLGRINITKIETTINQAILAIFENKNKINKKYLIYFLIMLEKNILIFANLNTQFNLNAEIVKNFILSFPPKKEQQAISTFLDKKTTLIDKKKTILKRKKELYLEYKQSLINQVVTKGVESLTKKDKSGNLIDFDNKAKRNKKDFDFYMNENGYKDSGVEYIGYIPKHWDVGRIKKDLIELPKSQVQVNQAKITPGKIKFFISGEKSFYSNFSLLNEEAIYLATGGFVNIKFFDKKAGYSTDTYVIKSKSNTKFLYYLILSQKEVIDKLEFMGMGIRHLQKKLLKNNFIPIIPNKTKKAISTFLDKKTSLIDKKIESIDKEDELLEEYKQVLINDVATGKIKVIKD